jgi:hypothetical protein
MLIWNGTEYKPFYAPVTPAAPDNCKRLTRDWVIARNESIAAHNAIVERARIRFAADPRFVGAANAALSLPIEMPDWCK